MKKRNKKIEMKRDLELFIEQLENGEIKDSNGNIYSPVKKEACFVALCTDADATTTETYVYDKSKNKGEIKSLRITYSKIRNNFEWGYIVSDEGDLFSRQSTEKNKFYKWLALNGTDGREQYNLKFKGKYQSQASYKLVALAFNVPCSKGAGMLMEKGEFEGITAHHINSNLFEAQSTKDTSDIEQRKRRRKNCKIDNLKFVTNEEHAHFISDDLRKSNITILDNIGGYYQKVVNGKTERVEPLTDATPINSETELKEISMRWKPKEEIFDNKKLDNLLKKEKNYIKYRLVEYIPLNLNNLNNLNNTDFKIALFDKQNQPNRLMKILDVDGNECDCVKINFDKIKQEWEINAKTQTMTITELENGKKIELDCTLENYKKKLAYFIISNKISNEHETRQDRELVNIKNISQDNLIIRQEE